MSESKQPEREDSLSVGDDDASNKTVEEIVEVTEEVLEIREEVEDNVDAIDQEVEEKRRNYVWKDDNLVSEETKEAEEERGYILSTDHDTTINQQEAIKDESEQITSPAPVDETDQTIHDREPYSRPPNPLAGASFWAQLTFTWPLALILKGNREVIEEKDIPEILNEEDSHRNRRRVEEVWHEELGLADEAGRNPSLHRALLRLYFRTLWYVQPGIAMTSASRIGQALALGRLIEYFEVGCSKHNEKDGYIWASVLIACTAVPLVSHHQTYFRAWRMGMQLRIGCVAAIYAKSLKLVSIGGTKTSSAGEMSNLASNDVERFLYASLFISYLFWAPLEAVVVLFVGIDRLGPAFAAGYVVLFTFVPMQFFLGKRFAKFRSQIAVITDQRVSLLSQAIQGVRVMKMSGWEVEFSDRINEIRDEEVRTIQTASRYRALNEAIYFATSASVAVVIFVVHVLLGNELTPRDVFTTLTLINVVQFTMTKFFAYAVMSVSECYVSVHRIQQFFELPEIEDIEETRMMDEGPLLSITGVSSYWDLNSEMAEDDLEVESVDVSSKRSAPSTITKGTARRSSSDKSMSSRSKRTYESEVSQRSIALENISLTLEPGRLYCAIGPVGCGKSALLMALAGELEPTVGVIERRVDRIAFASQEPWIMGGTVRENIIMGDEFDRDRYEEIIDACGLRQDLERFHSGDSTIVGDRGVQCSGGQRARLGLARALYRDADLVLLDDPLSAVDAKVGRLIFQTAIKDLCVARGKCVVLATHQYQLIEKETCILMKRGNVVQIAEYADCIVQSGGLLKHAHRSLERKVRKEQETSNLGEKQITKSAPTGAAAGKGNEDNREAKEKGVLAHNTWKDYIDAMGGTWVVVGVLSLFAVAQAAVLVTFTQIGRWAEKPFEEQNSPEFILLIVSLGLVVAILSVVRSMLSFFLTLKASRRLHDDMVVAVLRAKIEFFDTNPLGRILNRFSADVGSNDDQLPSSLNDTFSIGFIVLGATATAASVMPFILIAIPPIFWYFARTRRMFIAASRELKRHEGLARSPIFAMMSESINGIASIRTNGAIGFFQERFADVQNGHSRAFFSFIACTRWLNFRLESIQILLLSTASLFAVIFHSNKWFNVDPSILGLALTLLLQLSGLLQWAVRQSSEVINHMVAVERVAAYGRLEPEAPLQTQDDELVDRQWPNGGAVNVEDIAVRYRESLPSALSGLSFDVAGGQRIGVVGRTGSGKSTFIQVLFRLLEPENGSIHIDDIDIATLGLHKLRTSMSVIPQSPVLFSGWTIRENLDPFDQHSSERIIDAIADVQLQDIYNELPEGLNTVVADGGNNFSVGQRQLLCVARAILQNNKILVLDEPTANVDARTDHLLQQAVASSFPGATVIAIAHRLETIIDYDRILVVGDGKMLEYGPPATLLENENGHFYTMVADTGPSTAASLHDSAFGRGKALLEIYPEE